MFRRHPFKWLLVATIAGFCLWLRYRTVPVLPGDHLKTGMEALAAGNFSSAEQHFRDELRLVPDQPMACEQLALLLIRSGRSWEASPYTRTALKQQNIREDYLVCFTSDPDDLIDENMLSAWHRQSPEEPAPLTGLARFAFRSGQNDEARELLEKVLAKSPLDLEAHVLMGHVELTTRLSRLPEWNSKLPKNAESHPGIWFVRGDWCQQCSDSEMAKRCFLEGIRLNPDNREMNLRLGQLLGNEDGQRFLARAETLERTFNAVSYLEKRSGSAPVWEAVESLYSIGRFLEAAKWGQIAMTSDAQLMRRMTTDPEFSVKYRKISEAAESNEDLNPVSEIDLKAFPEWHPPAGASSSAESIAD